MKAVRILFFTFIALHVNVLFVKASTTTITIHVTKNETSIIAIDVTINDRMINNPWISTDLFEPQDKIAFIVLEDERVVSTDRYSIEIDAEDIKPLDLNIKTTIIHPGFSVQEIHETGVILDKQGKIYAIKIILFENSLKKLMSKEGTQIFNMVCTTHQKYSLGLNAGLFFPFEDIMNTYAIYYISPQSTSLPQERIFKENSFYQMKLLIFLSWYPFKIQPTKPISLTRNFQLSLGTEVSSSILSNIYLGFGWDLKYLSLNFFTGYVFFDRVPNEYKAILNKPIENPNFTNIPVLKQRDWIFGVAIALPFSTASLFGKILGL